MSQMTHPMKRLARARRRCPSTSPSCSYATPTDASGISPLMCPSNRLTSVFRIWRATNGLAKWHGECGAQRKTPAQRHNVTCGGPLRSNQISALGMPSIILDFVMSCRCQVVGNSLQPGGVMLIGHPPLS